MQKNSWASRRALLVALATFPGAQVAVGAVAGDDSRLIDLGRTFASLAAKIPAKCWGEELLRSAGRNIRERKFSFPPAIAFSNLSISTMSIPVRIFIQLEHK